MKKILLTLVGVICSLGMWADTESVLIPASAKTNACNGGFTYSTASVTATFGESTTADWKISTETKSNIASDGKSYTSLATATGGTSPSGGSATTVPTSGVFATFTPTANGVIDAFITLNSGKATYCLDKASDGTITALDLTYYPSGTLASAATISAGSSISSKYYGFVTFDVKAGHTYYLFCTGSKMGYYGFLFTASGNKTTTKVNDAVSNQKYYADNTSAETFADNATSITFSGIGVLSTTNGKFQAGNAQYQFAINGSNYTGPKVAKGTYVFTPANGVTVSSINAYASSNSDSKTITLNGTEESVRGTKNVAVTPNAIALSANGDGYYTFTVDGDNSQALVVLEITYSKVANVDVKVSSAGYATLYYGSDLIIPEGVTAYTMAAPDNGTAVITAITGGKIKAETGVILKADAGTYNFVTTTGAGDMSSALTGVTETTSVSANSVSTLGANDSGEIGLRTYSGTSIRAYSAYYNSPLGAKGFVNFSFDDVAPTAVANFSAQTVKNGIAYNLAGQRVNANAKGIVIINGKKYLNK